MHCRAAPQRCAKRVLQQGGLRRWLLAREPQHWAALLGPAPEKDFFRVKALAGTAEAEPHARSHLRPPHTAAQSQLHFIQWLSFQSMGEKNELVLCREKGQGAVLDLGAFKPGLWRGTGAAVGTCL